MLAHVILPTELDLLLSALEVVGSPSDDGNGIITGKVQPVKDLSKNPIPGCDFALAVPSVVQPAPFKLKYDSASSPTSFQFWLLLADQGQVMFIFKFIMGLPGLALTGAQKVVSADGKVSLEAFPNSNPKHSPVLVSRSTEPGAALGPAILISGSPDTPASMRFTPDMESTKGIVTFGLEPPTVVFGYSKIGFDCPAITIDDSEESKADGVGAPSLVPPLNTISADTPAWRGLLARQLDFYLPADIPLFGGHPIKGYLAIPFGDEGAQLVVETKVPARQSTPTEPSLPGYSIRIECLDTTARGLSGLVPTLISATMELPLKGVSAGFDGQAVVFGAGKPIMLSATFARDPVNAADKFKVAIGVSAQGKDGIVSVTSNTSGGAKIFDTVAALATALIADKDIERKADVGDTKGVVLYTLLATGTVLSSLFTNDSSFVLHGVEIESTGHGLPIGGKIVLTLDYSVGIRVKPVSIGVLSVSMSEDQPMRIRLRRVRMSVDQTKSGLEMLGLDFGRAEMDIENPGAWNVEGLDSLFDVLRSRSGRGSSWIEVDLRFKLNLGPINVSGATIRATLEKNGSITPSLRGLEAGLTIPGALEGSGQVHLEKGGFSAYLRAKIIPLNLAADADILYAPPKIFLGVNVDLPAPIPLANTGFGLFGIGGLFAIAMEPNYNAGGESDPILNQLKWIPKPDNFSEAKGQFTFGLSVAVGTLPDFGFSFSAKAGLLISVPEFAVRASLNGKVLQPVTKLTDPSFPPSPGISFLGFLGINKEALSFGLLGQVDLRPLLMVKIPMAGHFPFTKDTDDWYVYLGADGYPGGTPNQGRGIGPISARILPGILDVGADAYVMLRGRGIEAWPYGRTLPSSPITLTKGFVVAFGFSVQTIFGVKPIVWAELYASLDLMIGSKPLTLAGFGRAGGSLNLGPFSLGVEANVAFMVSKEAKYFWAQVTGRIELFFFDIEGTVTIAFGDLPTLALPDADLHPLDLLGVGTSPGIDQVRIGTLGTLTDDTYRIVSRLVENPSEIKPEMLVWPDTIVSLPFAVLPEIKSPWSTSSSPAQFPGVAGPGAMPTGAIVGSEMLHYSWRLEGLELCDVTDELDPILGPGTRPAGQLAARWQVPRSGGGGGVDVSELVLFSQSADLWVNRLADGGEGNPKKPLKESPNICHHRVSAIPGWAIGFLSSEDDPGFRLPPDPVSQDILVSRVEARMHHFALTGQGEPISLDEISTLPQPYSLTPARLDVWPGSLEIKHLFSGHIVAPSLQWLPGEDILKLMSSGDAFLGQQIDLDMTEPIVDGVLIIVADRILFDIQENFMGILVFDNVGLSWLPPDLYTLPTGETAGFYHAPTSDPVTRVTIKFPIGRELGIVGIGGITVMALSAAAAENAAIADENARLSQAAKDGPKTDPELNKAYQRAILRPGRLYRLELDMVWSGKMFKQNEAGQVVPVDGADRNDEECYTPKGSVIKVPNKRRLFFKTAPKPTAAASAPEKYGLSDGKYKNWIHKRQDVFHPEMIQRYLAGYDPRQSEEFRFRDDPIRAHFRQDHVAALSKAYGFEMKVAVRRVDASGPLYATPILGTAKWTYVEDPLFLTDTDQLRYQYAVQSGCQVPTPGASATVNLTLEPNALYEVYVLAKSTDPAFIDGRLPGVTFKTSRWRKPSGLFTGLGFTTAGGEETSTSPSLMVGDLVIKNPTQLTPSVIEGDDQAFQNALAALGLEGWPVSDEPRLSRMWISDGAGGWLFAGLMIESPEPIHRMGRLELNPEPLTLSMGIAGTVVHFNIRRRDRSGCRAIFLTPAPFRVVTGERIPLHRTGMIMEENGDGRFGPGIHYRNIVPQLVIRAKSILGKVKEEITGVLTLPTLPSFSEDP